MKAFLTNIIIASVWLILGELVLWRFFVGYILGFLILNLFPNVLGNETYINKVFGLIYFIRKFAWEFIKANFNVAKIVLFFPKDRLKPFFFTYDVSNLKKLEILLLSQCITLTPGTITVLFSEEDKTLLIHVLTATDSKKLEMSIQQNLQDPLLAFTRGCP